MKKHKGAEERAAAEEAWSSSRSGKQSKRA